MKKSLLISLFALTVTGVAFADDNATAGRKILAKYQDAVVTVRLMVGVNVSFNGRDQHNESKTGAIGTVIDPSGLTVISLSAIDPSEIVKNQLPAAQKGLKFDTEVKDVKIVLADETELPAEVVLRDKDLDLAYLRPSEKPSKPLVALDLTKSIKPQVLDEVVTLNRLGKVANRVVTVSLERVDALVTKPRLFYTMGVGGSSGVGSPVFTLTGVPLGIILIRSVPTDNESSSKANFGQKDGFTLIVVPTADILEDAKQALETKKLAATETK